MNTRNKTACKSTRAITNQHRTSAAKQQDSDHAKNAFAVSGTSPTLDTVQIAPATPALDTTPPKVCTRLGCKRPLSGKHLLYCSRACSAATRNRRYYLTLPGRMKKRAAQSRYFQKYRYELYEKRRTRFARYLAKEIDKIQTNHAKWREQVISDQRFSPEERDKELQIIDGVESFELAQAAENMRSLHDWHPNPYDGAMGRLVYRFTQDGRAVLMDSRVQAPNLLWQAMRERLLQPARKSGVSNA